MATKRRKTTQEPPEYHSAGDVLQSPVHNLQPFLTAHPCKSHASGHSVPSKRAWPQSDEHREVVVELLLPCRLALEMRTTHDLHHTWIYDRWIRTETAFLIVNDEGQPVERVQVTRKDIGWEDRHMNVRHWNPGPPNEPALAERVLMVRCFAAAAAAAAAAAVFCCCVD